MPNENGATTSEKDLGSRVGEARARIEDAADTAKKAIARADKTLAAKMQENPILVLGIAVGVGYVIGRLFSKLS